MSMPVYTLSDSSSGSQKAANGEHLTAACAAQDNPVGTIRKSIYVIRNTVNDKVYVGQSINPDKRFLEHIQESKQNRRDSAIYGAIRKYGDDKFYMEILEEDVENYNERERYWISFFNSMTPNGYNIQPGGEDPPVWRGFSNAKCKFKPSDVPEIRALLKNRHVTMLEIASYYGVCYRTIHNINVGKTYRDDSVDYPIRKQTYCGEIASMLTSMDIEQIIFQLKNTDKSMRRIAIDLGVNHHQVTCVNTGEVEAYRVEGEIYPIRDWSLRPTEDVVRKIKKQLMTSSMCKHQIAEQNGVSYSVVGAICSGRSYFEETLVYPLRKDEGKLDIDEEVIESIRCDLKNMMSVKKIAKKYGVPTSFVYDVNSGKSHRSETYTYPIRTWEPKISSDIILSITQDIVSTKMSLTEIGKKYGFHKSTILCIKNGSSKIYRLPDYTYPLRPNGRCK